METIILSGGCFWCTEAIFKQLKGVEKVTPGYSGGDVKNPTYQDIVTGETNHAESVEIVFDPKIIKLKDLLYVFFKLHDPTTLNRQGADIGTQYRSAIFYSNTDQMKVAEEAKSELKNQYKEKIVTEITAFKNFYPAEEYHKDFYFKNRNNPYCTFVIDPKIQKLKKDFGNILK